MSEKQVVSTVKGFATEAAAKVESVGVAIGTLVANYKKTIIVSSLFGMGLPIIKLLQTDFGLLLIAALFAAVFIKLGGLQALSAPDETDTAS